jgi:hypothetical protein
MTEEPHGNASYISTHSLRFVKSLRPTFSAKAIAENDVTLLRKAGKGRSLGCNTIHCQE